MALTANYNEKIKSIEYFVTLAVCRVWCRVPPCISHALSSLRPCEVDAVVLPVMMTKRRLGGVAELARGVAVRKSRASARSARGSERGPSCRAVRRNQLSTCRPGRPGCSRHFPFCLQGGREPHARAPRPRRVPPFQPHQGSAERDVNSSVCLTGQFRAYGTLPCRVKLRCSLQRRCT